MRGDGWRALLRGIAIEEMLHLALVANVMSSIGAAPYFGRPNFPQRASAENDSCGGGKFKAHAR